MHGNEHHFSESLFKALIKALEFATSKKYEYLTIDNLMVFICDTKYGKEIFEAVGIDIEDFKSQVLNYIEESVPKIFDRKDPTQMTVSLNGTLQKANLLQKATGSKNQTDEGYIIAALFELEDEDECFTLNYFKYFKIRRFDFMNFITHGKKKTLIESLNIDNQQEAHTKSYLSKFAINLNNKASSGKIDKVIGREEEVKQIISILSQRKKNNPILVGEPGVGKTAIVESLAQKIINKDVPISLLNFKIYSLDLASLVAGAKYRGDFEERLKNVIKEASSDKNIVLFIDEIHTLIGAGAGSSAMDASNILKPSLASGEIKLIGATTYNEYKKHFEKEGALSRRFQKIEIIESSEKDSLNILLGLKEKYEEFHQVKYTDEALNAAIYLTAKYLKEKRLPDKAIDVIDMAGAEQKLDPNSKKIITKKDITKIVSRLSNIPLEDLEKSDKDKLRNLENTLQKQIFGQDEAINIITNNILLSKSTIYEKEKPIGSFLFAGPSGVGKTELAKQLAKQLSIPFIRLDMSEYMEKHNVARLIGTPPGYVGYEEGGQLTEIVNKTPYCVLLLDEIEKSHKDVFNILLQIMDYGILTDGKGNKTNFHNVILIMTSNVGAKEMNKNEIGFTKNSQQVIKNRELEIKHLFSPEFLNRLDSIVQFNALNQIDLNKIIIKSLSKLQENLSNKKIIMLYSDLVISHIAKNGFDEKMGARPIQRYIEKEISQLLSKEILFGNLENGGEFKIDIIDDKINFDFIHNYQVHDISNKIENIFSKELIIKEKKPRKKIIKKVE